MRAFKLCLCSLLFVVCIADAGCARSDLRIMSFNLRYGMADDGPNHWDNRKQLVADTISTFDPDILGVQECLPFQARFLRDVMPGYNCVGVGREDGAQAGEMVAILFRVPRFVLLDQGHFWLSETPEVPGSKSWDSSLTRMVSWVHLRERHQRRRSLYVFNTHFDHRGQVARVESARLLRRKVQDITAGAPAVVLGDFNAPATLQAGEPYHIIIEGSAQQPRWTDTYGAVHPPPETDSGTFHGFEGVSTGPRIDWIVITAGLMITDAKIVRHQYACRYPSDHFPVTAVLDFERPHGTRAMSKESAHDADVRRY